MHFDFVDFLLVLKPSSVVFLQIIISASVLEREGGRDGLMRGGKKGVLGNG